MKQTLTQISEVNLLKKGDNLSTKRQILNADSVWSLVVVNNQINITRVRGKKNSEESDNSNEALISVGTNEEENRSLYGRISNQIPVE